MTNDYLLFVGYQVKAQASNMTKAQEKAREVLQELPTTSKRRIVSCVILLRDSENWDNLTFIETIKAYQNPLEYVDNRNA